MTNGEPLVVRAAMKPIPTLMRPLRSVDLDTREPVDASRERSDVCAVPAAAVVAEAEVALVLADAYCAKFGGTASATCSRALAAYRRAHRGEPPLPDRLHGRRQVDRGPPRRRAARPALRRPRRRRSRSATGRAIAAIFARVGRGGVPRAETDALSALARRAADSVVACGGGVVLRDENRALLQAARHGRLPRGHGRGGARAHRRRAGRPLLAGEAGRARGHAARRRARAVRGGRRRDRRHGGPHAGGGRRRGRAHACARARACRRRDTSTVACRTRALRRASSAEGCSRSLGERAARRAAAASGASRSSPTTTVARAVRATPSRTSLRDGRARRRRASTVPPGEGRRAGSRRASSSRRSRPPGSSATAAVVALGGGVVGDLAGFCAAVVPARRPGRAGADDAARAGGQLDRRQDRRRPARAARTSRARSGSPRSCSPTRRCSRTLPDGEWRSGLAEVAKTRGARRRGASRRGSRRDAAALRRAGAGGRRRAPCALCVAFKARRRVGATSGRAGARECLNYGHTLGHAIEKVAGYGVVPHGLAVAEGMRFAARLAERPRARGRGVDARGRSACWTRSGCTRTGVALRRRGAASRR